MERAIMEVTDMSVEERIAPHLISLPDPRWALWRCAGLRAAGFSLEMLAELGDAELTALADAILDLEDRLRQARRIAIERVEARLQSCAASENHILERARRRLQRGKEAAPAGLDGSVDDCLRLFHDLNLEAAVVRTAFEERFAHDNNRLSATVKNLAGHPRFLEALMWQNRRVLETAIEPLCEPTTQERRSKRRQHEGLLVSYLQRYCAKNDTIGFFGPMGWARFQEAGPAVSATAGKELIASSEVYFEDWTIESLARSIEKMDGAKLWLVPRRNPLIAMEGETLHLADGSAVDLSREAALVLARCDGIHTAQEIATDLIFDSMDLFNSEDQALSILADLEQDGLIAWGIQLPGGPQALAALHAAVAKIEDIQLRRKIESSVDQLETCRKAVAGAAGKSRELLRAFVDLETTFTQLTGASSHRAAGLTYAGRSLLYQDCQRDYKLELGPEILEAIGRPLALFLESTNSLLGEIAALFDRTCRRIYRRLVSEGGDPVVRGNRFWHCLEPELLAIQGEAESAAARLQQKWLDLLAFSTAARRVDYAVEELAPRVNALFPRSSAAWLPSIYSSPDIMIAAPDVAAINEGRYLAVLGELHLSANTLSSTLFVSQHPDPEHMLRAREQDIEPPLIFLLPPKHLPRLTTRTQTGLYSPHDLGLDFSLHSSPLPGIKNLAMADLLVVEEEGELVVRSSNGQFRASVTDAFAQFLSALVQPLFRILPAIRHTPRLTCERLVFARESWCFDASECSFAWEKQESACFLEARRWARQNLIPRLVFVKTPNETKPVFLDCASIASINLFCKSVRACHESSKGGPIRITEMVPAPGDCWLVDCHGQRYTSELRLVVKDQWLAEFHRSRRAALARGTTQ
jgi:Lantibiotic dehydratase, N terminus